MDEDEIYAEWLADVFLSYMSSQLQSGRTHLYESELWQLVGHNLPEGAEDQLFELSSYKEHFNIVKMNDYRKKLQ